MKFVYDDGGRKEAGRKGDAGDCVTRAIAIATGRPYAQVYDDMAQGNAEQRITKRSRKSHGKRTASRGISVQRKWFKDYMAALAWKWMPTMGIGTGCTVHLIDGELPMGRLIVSVSGHYTTVIDGVIHDTHDPSANRGTTIYPPNYPGVIPKAARWLSNGNGWAYSPDRCVYGYWQPNF